VNYRVLRLTCAGGRSSKPAGPYSIALFASDVAAMLDALSIGRAHVVGLSLGGLVAQQMALDFSERVCSLALTNAFAHLLSVGVARLARLAWRGIVSLALPLERSAQHVARSLFPFPEQAELRRLTAARIAANDPAAYRASIAAIRRFDSRRRLCQITRPTLIVTGDRDRSVPRSLQRPWRRAFRARVGRSCAILGTPHRSISRAPTMRCWSRS
jgi:pimeloyl-ACP methyl ester carboxylesterase